MKFFVCDLEPVDRRYCIVEPEGFSGATPLAVGASAISVLEDAGNVPVRLPLDEIRGGLELPDLVPNICNHLIMSRRCADAVCSVYRFGDYEGIPVELINRQGGLHSGDYIVINPQGSIDCLDKDRSDMEGLSEGSSRIFGSVWLDISRTPRDRDVFRVEGVCTGYMFSERLVDYVRYQGFTNFLFREVPVA